MIIILLQLSFDDIAKYGGVYGEKNAPLSNLQVCWFPWPLIINHTFTVDILCNRHWYTLVDDSKPYRACKCASTVMSAPLGCSRTVFLTDKLGEVLRR